ncbi:MAG TPA: hypothetical protein DCS42_07315 [Nitrospiraceae bacterium]|nr:hypothetical protein [Nitrospiraceae bacterium]
MRAVRNVAKDRDPCAAVEPADIIGRASLQHDLGAFHAHAAAALACCSLDHELHDLAAGEDPAAEAVLAVCDDVQFASAVLHRLLDLFLKVLGGYALSVYFSLDDHHVNLFSHRDHREHRENHNPYSLL